MSDNRLLIFALLVALVFTAGQDLARAQQPLNVSPETAVAEIERIGIVARGTVGVAAVHLESGRSVEYRANEFFPMASAVKVAVAARILDMADRGQLSLAAPIPVEASEMTPDGPLAETRWRAGLAYSADELLDVMITRSDNTATDVLYRVAGGPAAVGSYLQGLGLKDIRPARYIRELLRDVLLIPVPASPKTSLADQFKKMSPKQADERRARAYRASAAYDADPRDQATPAAMLQLLRKIRLEEGISGTARETLISLMESNKTGLRRIRGRLPAGTIVADKTGTLAGTVNDVGFITLPDGKGTVALAVFIKGSEAPPVAREAVIADIARLLYDYYLLTTPGRISGDRPFCFSPDQDQASAR